MRINYIFAAILFICFYIIVNFIWPECSLFLKIDEAFTYLLVVLVVWISFKKAGNFWGSVISFFIVSLMIWNTVSGVLGGGGFLPSGVSLCRNIFTPQNYPIK